MLLGWKDLRVKFCPYPTICCIWGCSSLCRVALGSHRSHCWGRAGGWAGGRVWPWFRSWYWRGWGLVHELQIHDQLTFHKFNVCHVAETKVFKSCVQVGAESKTVKGFNTSEMMLALCWQLSSYLLPWCSQHAVALRSSDTKGITFETETCFSVDISLLLLQIVSGHRWRN